MSIILPHYSIIISTQMWRIDESSIMTVLTHAPSHVSITLPMNVSDTLSRDIHTVSILTHMVFVVVQSKVVHVYYYTTTFHIWYFPAD